MEEQNNIPEIHMSPETLKADFDMLLMSKYDIFFRRIVEYVLESIEGYEQDSILAILIDDEGNRFEMDLPKTGFNKSLKKANKYFEKIEEFETCELIKQMLQQI
tara:strand:+ start:230 stop:541 length:312 start_codon:yes stop_codon:yes gene_type:complete